MEVLKKVRTGQRSAFTKTLNDLNALLSAQVIDKEQVEITYELLQEKMADLNESSAKVLNAVLVAENAAAVFEVENGSTDEYKKKFFLATRKVTNLFESPNISTQANSTNLTLNAPVKTEKKKAFKLPQIEIAKFTGNPRDWLQFWNQFLKIHDDPQIYKADKFQHLIQSMASGSRAFDLVNSFPPTRDNYDKATTSLTNRFGKPELQVEVYVRELLNLVMNNALRGKAKISLATLYDSLETYMRALESLKVTSEKCAAMLLPLVESALPEEILRTWQRSAKAAESKDAKQRLTNLLEFVGNEVENEERIKMAMSGFTIAGDNDKKKHSHENVKNTRNVPTVTELLTTKTEKSSECFFCKNNHDSQECFKAKKNAVKRAP